MILRLTVVSYRTILILGLHVNVLCQWVCSLTENKVQIHVVFGTVMCQPVSVLKKKEEFRDWDDGNPPLTVPVWFTKSGQPILDPSPPPSLQKTKTKFTLFCVSVDLQLLSIKFNGQILSSLTFIFKKGGSLDNFGAVGGSKTQVEIKIPSIMTVFVLRFKPHTGSPC